MGRINVGVGGGFESQADEKAWKEGTGKYSGYKSGESVKGSKGGSSKGSKGGKGK